MSDVTQQKKRKRSKGEVNPSKPTVDEEITDPSSNEDEQLEVSDEEDALESEEEFEGKIQPIKEGGLQSNIWRT
ncbi:BBT_collapsed_G0057310.mRNA.1.CDS.1 [Saccharomyces cerevisiae]|nr:BBT_collapsed_G0057310.mRNA.1.CDS.1 [Saccharomyces cerevisiae]